MRKENRISSKKRKGYRDEKAALIILLIWIFLAVCVPLFGPYSPTEQNAEIRNQPMSLIHFSVQTSLEEIILHGFGMEQALVL